MASVAHLRGCWVRFAIDLHPSQSTDVLQGVREQLQSMLLRYSHELEGVMLAYSKEKILNSEARIHPYFPYFHVDVSALVYLFRPIVGSLMTGVVNAVGHDYVGVLVLGIFNAAIGREDIPSHWRSAPMERCWLSIRNARQRIKVGSTLEFAVHRTHHEGGFFTLAGSLTRPGVSLDATSALPAGTQPAAAQRSTAAATRHSAKRQKKRPRLPTSASAAPRSVGTQDQAPSQPQTPQQHQAPADVSVPSQPPQIHSPGTAATETIPRVQKRKRHREDSHATTAALPAGTGEVAASTAGPSSGHDSIGLEAAAARKLLKRQHREAAAAASAALPAGSPVADQPSHRKETKKRRSEATSTTTGVAMANGLLSSVKQPKKKKHKSAQQTG